LSDQPLELLVQLRGETLPRPIRFNPSDAVGRCVEHVVQSTRCDPALKWCLYNPDPSVDLALQYLDMGTQIKAYAFRTHHVLELRQAPLQCSVYHATRNSNLMSSLVGPVQMALDRHSELVFNIRRFQQAITTLVEDEEYTFALIERQPGDKYRALWVNANTSLEMNNVHDNFSLLLWPLSLFMTKSAESLKDPLIAGTVKMTKQENESGSSCDTQRESAKFHEH
jgi:hypothetical protein